MTDSELLTRLRMDQNEFPEDDAYYEALLRHAANAIEQLLFYKTEYEALLIQHQDLLRRSQQ